MKKGDNVWISWQDIDACGYGDSVNTDGVIVNDEDSQGRFWVRFKSEEYPYFSVEREFYSCDLKVID